MNNREADQIAKRVVLDLLRGRQIQQTIRTWPSGRDRIRLVGAFDRMADRLSRQVAAGDTGDLDRQVEQLGREPLQIPLFDEPVREGLGESIIDASLATRIDWTAAHEKPNEPFDGLVPTETCWRCSMKIASVSEEVWIDETGGDACLDHDGEQYVHEPDCASMGPARSVEELDGDET